MSTAYHRVPEAIDATVDGEVVILSPVDFSYHALDAVGARVWTMLSDPRSLDELIDALTQEYDVTPEQCRSDVVPFLERMCALGAVRVGD